MSVVVLDTNIVLDLFVFADEASQPLHRALALGPEQGGLHWLATLPMRDELARVLDYPQIAPRLAFYALDAAGVLARFDARVRLVAVPAKAPVTCADADDQKFIDLAVVHGALLLSKDKDVLSMRKRLSVHGVRAQSAIDLVAQEIL
ncbi:MAG: PIN domain-containing protein [Ramlibacter sp.]